MKFHVRIAVLPALALLGALAFTLPTVAAASDMHLQRDAEVRSRLLAFKASDLETNTNVNAGRRLQIEIRNGRRASVFDVPTGDILFTPSQCRMSEMKLTCETDDVGHLRQLFISRISGDAVLEGYTETSDEKSALTVERYSCVKEDREPLF